MEVTVTKKDVITGYIAQIFNYGTGVIVLPVILHKLSAAEIGMNYVMLAVGAFANMADFGFSGQIGRNVTYVLSGAQKIFRGEVEDKGNYGETDYRLLKTIIDASKFLYRRLSLAVLTLLLLFGSLYISHATDGFTSVDNSLAIWILYSISVYFNLYFLYYNSLLEGAGLIKELRLSSIYSRITYIALCFALVFSGFGLMSIVVANLVAPFVARFYCYKKFYSKEMRDLLPEEKTDKKEVQSALSDIWATAKKSGTNAVGHYIGTQGSTFIAGAYLPLEITAQWGLMTQLFGVVQGLASNMGMSYYPEYCKYRITGDKENLVKKSSFSFSVMFIILIIGGVAIILLCPWLLRLLSSETKLPSVTLMCAYLAYLIVLTNAQLFAMLMTSRNVIPQPAAVLLTAAGQLLLTIVLLQFTNLGIWALLLGPAISGGVYTLWKWMELELNNLHISAFRFYFIGFREFSRSVAHYYSYVIHSFQQSLKN